MSFAPFKTQEEKEEAQRLFNESVSGVYKQGRQSVKETNVDSCAYRGKDGLKCAVGFLIKDEDEARIWDDVGSLEDIRYSFNNGALEKHAANKPAWMVYGSEYFAEETNEEPPTFDMLQSLQFAHDGIWHKEQPDFRKAFWERALLVAKEYDLTMPSKEELDACISSSTT